MPLFPINKLPKRIKIILFATSLVFTAFSVKAQNWLLAGNAGTSSSNFIGTTDAQPLIFKTNATERLRISNAGNLLVGKTTDDGAALQVTGKVHIETAISNGFVLGNTPGSVHFAYDGTTARTTIALLTSRNFSTSSNGSTMFIGDGSGTTTDKVLFMTGAHVIGYQQPFLIKRGYPHYGSSLVVDDDGQVGTYPSNYKIASFNLNAVTKASIDKDGGAQFSGSVQIGTTTVQPSAKMEILSTTQGFLPPRMTTTQRNAISSPAIGLLVYDNTLNNYSFYNGTAWNSINGSQQWAIAGSDISYSLGSVGIGTASIPATYKLAVAGNIIAEKVRIKLQSSGWPDYVFDSSYRLQSLYEVEKYIKQFNRLPEMLSAKEIGENALDVGDNQVLLVKKIEELTLHLIEQNKRLDKLELANKNLETENDKMKKKLAKIASK